MTDTTNQTDPRRDGKQTSEGFWHKVFMILSTVVAASSFLGEGIAQVSGLLPAGSSFLRWAGIVGGVAALVGKVSYEASRTVVKLKLVDAEIETAKAPTKTPDAAAATVLGGES